MSVSNWPRLNRWRCCLSSLGFHPESAGTASSCSSQRYYRASRMLRKPTYRGRRAMATREEKSYCRICSGLCGMLLTVEEKQKIVSIRGDKQHPLTRGYACIKGLQAVETHYGEQRLLHPQKLM